MGEELLETLRELKTKTSSPQKIAFITYNRIGDGSYQNGVIEREGKQLFLYQNGHLSEWAADSGSKEDKKRTREYASEEVLSRVGFDEMDKIYMYVGSEGSEKSISITKDIPPDKITYVLCNCNVGYKLGMIEEIGNVKAEIIRSECGGTATMERILQSYLK